MSWNNGYERKKFEQEQKAQASPRMCDCRNRIVEEVSESEYD